MFYIDVNLESRECSAIEPDASFPGYMKISFISKIRKGFVYHEWYKTSDFITNNPQLAHLAKSSLGLPKDELGVVSKATAKSLTDKTKNWQVNEFLGGQVWISRGKGEGQTRPIESNTHNQLVIKEPFEITPDKTSQYLISFNVHDPQVVGNTLPIEQTINNTPMELN